MKLKKILEKKSLKLILLLFTSLLIGSVSATTYFYLNMNGTITVGSRWLGWIQNGTPVPGSTVSPNLGVQVDQVEWINTTSLNGIYLKNTDTTSHPVAISVTTALSSSDFDYAYMYVYDNSTGSLLHTFDLTSTGGFVSLGSLASNNAYLLDFHINGTIIGTYDFSVQAQYQ